MYACGLRTNEARPLAVHSIDGGNQILRIIGKGNKERLIPIPTPILQALRDFWKTHRNKQWLFPNQSGSNAISSCILYRAFKDALILAGLPIETTPHALRHSYATRLAENDVDIRTVQILMGHADIKTTTIYTHLTEPRRKKLRNRLDDIMTNL